MSTLLARTGKLEVHQAGEVWRLIASLERLSAADKIRLGETVIQELPRGKNEKLRPALLWALGRIGSRQPIYGPLNTAVPAAVATKWIESLIGFGSDEASTPLAITQLARKTGDRYRDLDERIRVRAVEYLSQTNANPHFSTLLMEGGKLSRDEETAVFGDSLPLGIRLGR